MAEHEEDFPRIHGDHLKHYIIELLTSYGMRHEDARLGADILVESDLRGIDSHGVPRLQGYVERIKDGLINLEAELVTVRETASTVTFDAQNGFGPPMAHRAMERTIAKAQESGICLSTVGHSNHFGIAGYYATMALDHPGMAGIAMTNATPLLVPTNAREAALSTAPIASAFPAGVQDPFVFDAATTAVAWGKIEIARRSNKPIPRGWAVDAEGQPVEDPHRATALMPLGGERITSGQKGYGLSLLVEVLCSQLSGSLWSKHVSGSRSDPARPADTSHVFMAINIDAFRPLDEFAASMDDMLGDLRSMEPVEGQPRVMVPGDPEAIAYADRTERGIPVHPSVVDEMRAMAREAGIEVPF